MIYLIVFESILSAAALFQLIRHLYNLWYAGWTEGNNRIMYVIDRKYRWFCNININYYYSLRNKQTLDDFIIEFASRGPLHDCVVSRNLFDGERKMYIMILSLHEKFLSKYFGKSEGLPYRFYRHILQEWKIYLKEKTKRERNGIYC